MIFQGIDLAALPDQFKGCVQGRTLILDGDGPAYVCASTCKRLDTAIRRFQQHVLTRMFVTKSQSARVHFTASGSRKAGRFGIKAVKPYQGNRKDKAKPSLLEPLREAMANRENWLEEFDCILHHELEADDGMIMDAYQLKELGVIESEDKDLRMTPYLYSEISKGVVSNPEPFGWLQPKVTGSGTVKLIGQGPLFFWAQMLMGDTADNIKGVLSYQGKLCGPSGAYAALCNAKDIHEAANLVLDAYREIDQNPLPEGWLLWLLRWEGDNFWKYLSELNISEINRIFLNQCVTRDWFDRGEECQSE